VTYDLFFLLFNVAMFGWSIHHLLFLGFSTVILVCLFVFMTCGYYHYSRVIKDLKIE
jgi:hypothetical protein